MKKTEDRVWETSRTAAGASARLPVRQLLALTTAGFLAIVTETMPAGLLPRIGAGLGVSEGLAGQFITVYAIGSVVAAIPVIAATRGVRRRPLLLCGVIGLLVFNSLTALSGTYVLSLVGRLGAGMSSGVIWGLLSGYTRRLVPLHQQGRALAVMGVGQPIALCFGVPLGTALGALVGWRGVFWTMSVAALLLGLWIRLLLPDFPGQKAADRQPIARTFTTPGVRPVLAVMFLWILAHNILYTYIAPFASQAGLSARVDVLLAAFGLAAIVGIWLTGIWTDRHLRALTLGSLVLFTASAALLGAVGGHAWAVFAGVATWGLAFGGAPTLLQTALADAAGEAADVAQSMFVTFFNLAVAGGGLLGGVLLEGAGTGALPWSLVALALAAVTITAAFRTHAFVPGPRGLRQGASAAQQSP